MKTYAHVVFLTPGDRGGAEQQRTFTNDLISAGIIQMTDEKIEEYFQKDKKTPSGGIKHIVLHNRKERKAFINIMKWPEYEYDGRVFYRISLTPGKQYGDWLKTIRKVRKEAKKDGKREKMRQMW